MFTLLRNFLITVGAGIVLFGLTYAIEPFRDYQLATVAAYLCATAGLTVLLGLAAALVAGVVIGLAAARLRGPYLAGVTLAVAVVVPAFATVFSGTFKGDQGLSVAVPPPPEALGLDFP